MAINKTVFTGANLTAQYSQLSEWLQANGIVAFDSVTDNGSTISCKPATGNGGLYINKSLNQITITTPKTASSSKNAAIFFSNYKFDFGVATSKGIYLQWTADAENPQYPSGIFVSKSNEDTTFILWHTVGYSSTQEAWIGTINLSDMELYTTDWQTMGKSLPRETIYGSTLSAQATFTALTPVVALSSESYCPHINILTFNQYYQQSGILTLNDNSYYTNGYFALAD